MISDVFYLAAYICCIDEKIYDESYFKIMYLIEKEKNSTDIANEILKILGDVDNKIPLETVIANLKMASSEEKDLAIALSLNIAFADDYFSEDEKQFINKICFELEYPKEKYEDLFNKIKLGADEEIQKDVIASRKLYGKSFYRLMSKIAPENLKERFQERYINCLLSGPDYNITLKEMRQISNEDIKYAKEAFDTLSDTMERVLTRIETSRQYISTISEKLKEENQDVSKCLNEIKAQITALILQMKTQIAVSLKKKEISAKYYTISFIGRTKAGKSTLHSILLGGINNEFIGVGKERTTRFNRIYKWNGIRIIDTPGIAAPGDGGKSDVEIARSVIDETDLICFVVTDDSTQVDELNFLEELKKQNKPIIILFNKKENLDKDIHKKRFLENPLKWYERNDNNAIEGNLLRIKEYAESHYDNAYFDIVPVQLKAAQLALTETNSDIKEKLEKGSRIKYFKDSLQIQILENGKIKRSQTILNGSIYWLLKYKSVFASQIRELEAIKETLHKQAENSISKIKKVGEATLTSLEKGLNSIYDDFIQNKIRIFVNDHYGQKKDVIDSSWKKYFDESGFETSLRNRLEREIESYKTEIENIMQEFSENLSFAFERLEINYDLKGTFDTKTFVAITGGILGIASAIVFILPFSLSNPIGWILTGISLVISVIAGFIKSKDKKIKESQDKLYESIKKAFNKNRSDNIKKLISNFKQVTDKTETSIENTLSSLSKEIGYLISNLEPIKQKCEYYESFLNKLYGIRILNFAKGYKREFDISSEKILSHIQVEQDFAKEIRIKTDLIKRLNKDKLINILQEDFILEAL